MNMKKKFNTFLSVILFLTWGIILVSVTETRVKAAELEVTTTQDNIEGSLRFAITTANTSSENDIIYLKAGTYILQGEADEDANMSGDLDIDNNGRITLIGEGEGGTIIDGNHSDRIFHIIKGTLSISGITIRNGKARNGQDSNENGQDGGGIYNNGSLAMIGCSIFNNTCGKGYDGFIGLTNEKCPGNGGYGGGIFNNGILNLNNCSISGNRAGEGGNSVDLYCDIAHGGKGGGIYNSENGSMELKNCFIVDNTSGKGIGYGDDHDVNSNGGDGGGIYNAGTQQLSYCTIDNNITGIGGFGSYTGGDAGRSGHGGGIYNKGVSTIDTCSIKNNATGNSQMTCLEGESEGDGGGIYNTGTIEVTESTISFNETGTSGSGGGIHNYSGTITLTMSAITNNKTGNGLAYDIIDGGSGGGIYNEDSLTLINCTVSTNSTGEGNESTYSDGGNGGDGGGICNLGTIDIKNSTICNNTAGEAGAKGSNSNAQDGKPGYGGGICNLLGTINIKNTILANNQISAGSQGIDGWGNFNSLGYNLIENTNYCSINGILTGNITGQDPLLGKLTLNDGVTETHALLGGSPAIDAGNSTGIDTDQRGYARPFDYLNIANISDGSDIGAYEKAAEIFISGTITSAGGGVPGVTLTFSNNGGSTSTNETGYYSHPVDYEWTGTVTPEKEGYSFSPANRNYTNLISSQSNQNYSATSLIPAQLYLNRTQMVFGADTNDHQSENIIFLIENKGGGIMDWNITTSSNWINCTPSSGNGTASITTSINTTGLSEGTYNGTITVEAVDALNSPQTIEVTLNIYNGGTTELPLGVFDTPTDGAIVTGSIAVTGWAIDDLGIKNVKIYRKSISGEENGLIYIGDAVLVEGARPDIETAYPDYPENYKAGWGYMLLTNAFPNQGNGTFTLYAKVTDREGNCLTLEPKTIQCDNVNAENPFGAIDKPKQGGIISGNAYVNFGWALTPLPNTIPTNGSTINVWIDGVPLGQPFYNDYREDIATLFPGYNNSNGAGGHFFLDTTKYENGVHTIAWSVKDNAGNTDGIGSRYFNIQNSSNQQKTSAKDMENVQGLLPENERTNFIYNTTPVRLKKGFNSSQEALKIYPDQKGTITIEIPQLERIEVYLSDDLSDEDCTKNPGDDSGAQWKGYQVIHLDPDTFKPLPVGSTFDAVKGIFIWQPGPAALGDYELVFRKKLSNGETYRKSIRIRIHPQ